MVKNRVIEFWVGVLMILAVLGLAFLALEVSGLSMGSFNNRYYSVTEAFPSVSNLKVRSPVRIAGVQVGQVTHIHLDPKSLKAIVTMRIEDQFKQIPSDSVGQVASSSLLGDNYISIAPGVSSTYLHDDSRLKTSTGHEGGLSGILSSLLGGGGVNPSATGADYYSIHEAFANVGGLTPGAPVKVSGVKIGQVTQISLNKETFLANVTMSIKREYQLPIDSIGQVASVSLIGGTYINLTPGAMPQNVKPGQTLEKRGIGPTDISNLISNFVGSGDKKK